MESFFSLKFRQRFPGTLCSLKTHLYINMLCYEFWVADDLVLCFYSWFSCLCALITMFGENKNHLTNVIPRCNKCCQIQLDCLRTHIEGLNLGSQRKFLICAKKRVQLAVPALSNLFLAPSKSEKSNWSVLVAKLTAQLLCFDICCNTNYWITMIANRPHWKRFKCL